MVGRCQIDVSCRQRWMGRSSQEHERRNDAVRPAERTDTRDGDDDDDDRWRFDRWMEEGRGRG